MPKTIGMLLNARYQLEAELGWGDMGRVYRAHDPLLHCQVAVKVLSAPELGTEARLACGEPGDRERAQELLREAQAAFEEMGIPRYAAVAQTRLEALAAVRKG